MSKLGTAAGGEHNAPLISRMTEHDLVEVVEIEVASGLSRWGWDAYYAELRRPSESIMLVARIVESLNAHHLAGFVAARLGADELHINNVAVRENWRQRGIGGLLLGAALEEAARRGAHRAFLEVRAGNEAAQALYSKFGFRSNARRPSYYTDPTEDAIVMTAPLDGSLT